MITNELLTEKYRTQKALDAMAGHDLARYVSDAHSRVTALSARLGLNLQYGIPDETPEERGFSLGTPAPRMARPHQ